MQLVSTEARAWLPLGAQYILRNLEGPAGVGAGTRALKRRGEALKRRGEDGERPKLGFLGLGLCPRLQPFNSMHIH